MDEAAKRRQVFDNLYAGLRNRAENEEASNASVSDFDIDDDEDDEAYIDDDDVDLQISPPAVESTDLTSNRNNDSMCEPHRRSNLSTNGRILSGNGVASRAPHSHNYQQDEISSDADTIEPAQEEIEASSPPPSPSPSSPSRSIIPSCQLSSSYNSVRPQVQVLSSRSMEIKSEHLDNRGTRRNMSKRKEKKKRRTQVLDSDSDAANEMPSDGIMPIIAGDTSSGGSSSDETLPPPSPSHLSSVHPAVSASNMSMIQPQIIDPDNDCSTINVLDHNQRMTYPKFKERQFRFKRTESTQADKDMILSSLPNAAKMPFKVPTSTGILPKAIATELSLYQRDGVMFLYRLFERKRGGLLADAMGLGKTVQTICFLGAAYSIWDYAETQPRNFDIRILVVAPASVRQNWKNEFETWSPFRVALYDPQNESTLSRNIRDGKVDVVVTSDHPVKDHTDFFINPLARYEDDEHEGGRKAKWKWHAVIIDEIHVAKNKRTAIFQALEKIPRVSAFGLTGTAIQNHLKELHNVLRIVVPDSLLMPYKPFKAQYIDTIDRGSKKNAPAFARCMGRQRIVELRQKLSKHIVRRPKCILDDKLPGKTDYCVLMRMKRGGLQANMYQRFQHSYDVKLLRDMQQPCDCGSEQLSRECCHRFPTTPESLMRAPIWKSKHPDNMPCDKCPRCICLPVQHYSRWIATHAFIGFPEDDEKDHEKAILRREVMEYYLGDKYAHYLNEPFERKECDVGVSCKLTAALTLIREYKREGHKTIIFYESLKLGEILKRWAVKKGITFELIDGSVKKDRRQGIVDRFNEDISCSVFFISKKAGSTGLNIASADRVLIFEPCWNPIYDLQAGDRAHRLGQTREVQIIRFVIEQTIEHYIFKNATAKTQLSNAVLDNTKEEWRVSEEELGSMYAMLGPGDDDGFIAEEGDERNGFVDFQVIAADLAHDDQLEKLSVKKKRTKRKNEKSRKKQWAKESGVEDCDDEDDEDIEEKSETEFDILGKDQIMCALDVDLDADGLGWVDKTTSKPKGKQRHANDSPVDDVSSSSESEDDPESDSADMGGDKDEDNGGGGVPESQSLAQMLQGAGAAKPLVMMATSARKARKQVLGRACKLADGGGINAGGANEVNLDDDTDKRWSNRDTQESTQQDLFNETPEHDDENMDDISAVPRFDFNLVSDDDDFSARTKKTNNRPTRTKKSVAPVKTILAVGNQSKSNHAGETDDIVDSADDGFNKEGSSSIRKPLQTATNLKRRSPVKLYERAPSKQRVTINAKGSRAGGRGKGAKGEGQASSSPGTKQSGDENKTKNAELPKKPSVFAMRARVRR